MGIATVLPADVVYLKNGRHMEGEILSETASSVVLKMGPSELILKKSRIANIQKSSPEEKAEREEALRRKYFFHDAYIDPALTEEGALYRSLQGVIQSGSNAQKQLRAARERVGQLEKKQTELIRKRATLADRVLTRDPGEDIERYNRRIEEHNQMQFNLVSVQSRLAAAVDNMQQNREKIRTVIRRIRNIEQQLAESRERHSPLNEDQRYFFEQADALIASANGLHKRINLPFSPLGDHAVVDVILNRKVTARLMVDTGASVLTLTPDIAEQLELKRDRGVTVPMRLADGKTVDMEPVIIQHVAVGEAEAQNIAAVIIPEDQDAEFSRVDGLLGMSFLRNFDLNINPANGKIELIDFQP